MGVHDVSFTHVPDDYVINFNIHRWLRLLLMNLLLVNDQTHPYKIITIYGTCKMHRNTITIRLVRTMEHDKQFRPIRMRQLMMLTIGCEHILD